MVRGAVDLSDLACGLNSSRTRWIIVLADKLEVPLEYEFTDLVGDIDLTSSPKGGLAPASRAFRLSTCPAARMWAASWWAGTPLGSTRATHLSALDFELAT